MLLTEDSQLCGQFFFFFFFFVDSFDCGDSQVLDCISMKQKLNENVEAPLREISDFKDQRLLHPGHLVLNQDIRGC